MLTPAYPIELEQWWLDEARRHTGRQAIPEVLDALRDDVVRLSDHLTVKRGPGFGGYAGDPELLLAYGLYLFPQNFVRAQWVLAEWLAVADCSAAARPLRVLDWGCGLGASACAVAQSFSQIWPGRAVEVRARDIAPRSLAMLQRVFAEVRALWPTVTLDAAPGDLRSAMQPDPPCDLILVSFVLNEVSRTDDDAGWLEILDGWMAGVAPAGALILIEPAGHESSGRLERLRDAVAAAGRWRIAGPCLHARPCPLQRQGGEYCHDVRPWRVPATLAYLNRKMQRTLADLKHSFLILAHPAGTRRGGADRFRMVSPLLRARGRRFLRGCAADGELRTYEVLERNLDRARVARLRALARGDILRAVEPRAVGTAGVWRAAAIERVLPGMGLEAER